MDLGQVAPGQAVRGQAVLKDWVEATAGFELRHLLPPSSFLGRSVGRGTMAHREQEQTPWAPIGVVFFVFSLFFLFLVSRIS